MNGTNVIKFNPITIPDPPFDEPLNPSHVPYARATKNRVHMRHVGNSGKVSAVGFEFIEANLRRSDFSDMFDCRIHEIQIMETTTCRSIAEKPISSRATTGRRTPSTKLYVKQDMAGTVKNILVTTFNESSPSHKWIKGISGIEVAILLCLLLHLY